MISNPLSIELALLGFLRQRPMYGYEIYQRLSEPSGLGLVWRPKQSHLYALLGRLEQAGLVTTTVEAQEVRPPRKVFQLTERGREALREWLATPVKQGRQFRLDFLAKLYVTRWESPAVAHRLLERQTAACQEWLRRQQALVESVAADRPFDRLVHQYRAGQIEGMLGWLERCREALVERPASPGD